MEEVLKSIGIDKEGVISESGSYVVDLEDSEEYGKIFAILEQAENEGKIEELEDSSVINIHTTDVSYTITSSDDNNIEYEISLLGDLDQNIYKLVLTKFSYERKN